MGARGMVLMGAPVMGGGRDTGQVYANLLVDTYSASEVWRLTDVVSTTIPAQVNVARNGAATGWTLQDAASPVTKETLKAPYSDGLNDYGNILTSGGGVGLVDIFNRNEASIFVAAKFPAAAWTDSTARQVLYLSFGGYMSINKTATTNIIQIIYYTGSAVWIAASPNLSGTTSWFTTALTASVSAAGGAGEAKAFVNGSQSGATVGLPGAISSSAFSRALIGAASVTPTSVLHGHVAYVALKFGTPVWTPTQIAGMHSALTA